MFNCETCGTEFEFVHTKDEVNAMEGLNARSKLALQTLIKCPKCGNQRTLTPREIFKLFKEKKKK